MNAHRHNVEECCIMLAQLNDYVDGELASDVCAVLEQHVDSCQDCQTMLHSLTTTIELYHQLHAMPIELPAGVEERLVQRLEREGLGSRLEGA